MNDAYYGSYEQDQALLGRPSNGGGRTGLSVRDYMHLLLERIWVIATVLAIVMVVAVYQVSKSTPLYRATARIQMDVPQAKEVESSSVVDVNTRDFTFIHTQVKILESRSLAQEVVERLALTNHPAFAGHGVNVESLAGVVQGMISVAEVKTTRMVDISASHPDRKVAALVANGMARGYIQVNLNSRMDASMDAVQWLRREADELKSILDKAELALQDYKEKTLSTSIVDEQNVVLAKLQDLGRALTEAQTQRLQIDTECKRIEALINSGGDLTTIDVIASDPLVAQIQSDILDKQSEIEVLKTRYKEKHPALLNVLQQQSELKDKLVQACLRVASNMQAKLSMERAKEDALRKALEFQQKAAFELDRKLMQYNELQRNVEADRELYNSVLSRMKETSVSGKLETNNVRLIDEAMVPSTPFNINKPRSLVQAGVFGLVLGIGLALLLHFADDRVKRTEEIEQNLGLPVLAVIPRIVRKRQVDRARVTELDRQSPAAESFRTFRASLALSPAAKKARRIMITSASPSAGKSLVASNLATVFAHNGLKTLLVDADLRRPSQHRAFEINMPEGLSHVLAGNINWKNTVVHTATDNLDLIIVGAIPPNPAELLGSPEMEKFLQEASKTYDKIILDAPPVFGLSDPLVLLQRAEGIVFVVHFNKSRRRNLTHAIQKLREGDTPLIGAVMNDVDLRRPSGYYYYYHQYGYYYDNEGTKKHKRKRS